ncbi:hypothetical protein ACCAA_720020 [Candidatus Accumulibacter aalborgensis]|uniref:Uncharacterized protein n=1 Tax=Candidatus Accumulibacter aalborgensis TaxID=1860102 RepID=A0A1A8XX33_9PROT|nr:hypothetical protein [Candidatus Accumulibacter aalborgensis]SBT09535.1 hypothetical protein ACCAA_720020 [Candidatus Accumulibacter aalborgensis]
MEQQILPRSGRKSDKAGCRLVSARREEEIRETGRLRYQVSAEAGYMRHSVEDQS